MSHNQTPPAAPPSPHSQGPGSDVVGNGAGMDGGEPRDRPKVRPKAQHEWREGESVYVVNFNFVSESRVRTRIIPSDRMLNFVATALTWCVCPVSEEEKERDKDERKYGSVQRKIDRLTIHLGDDALHQNEMLFERLIKQDVPGANETRWFHDDGPSSSYDATLEDEDDNDHFNEYEAEELDVNDKAAMIAAIEKWVADCDNWDIEPGGRGEYPPANVARSTSFPNTKFYTPAVEICGILNVFQLNVAPDASRVAAISAQPRADDASA